MKKNNIFFSTIAFITYAFILGTITAYAQIPVFMSLANETSKIFTNLLMLISLPLIFLSVISTITGMQSLEKMKHLGKLTIKYTLLTTLWAVSLSLILFKIIKPVQNITFTSQVSTSSGTGLSVALSFLSNIIPSNFIEPFGQNSNVAAVIFLALMLSFAILALPNENKKPLHSFFDSLFKAILKMTNFLILIIPIGVWAFTTIVIRDIQQKTAGVNIQELALYILCILLANIIHATIILPLFLKFKKIRPFKTFKGISQALVLASLSRSSATALPITLKKAKTKLGISKPVANFVFPLCATINMDGAAIFIFTTVMFVAMNHGIYFSLLDMILWMFIATLAAIGSSAVPMSAYFLASSLIATLGIPLHIMGVILPIYAVIDILDSSVNVWGDTCIATVIDKELKEEAEEQITDTLKVTGHTNLKYPIPSKDVDQTDLSI